MIIVCVTGGGMGTGVFIVEDCIDGCSLYIGKLMGVFGEREEEMPRF